MGSSVCKIGTVDSGHDGFSAGTVVTGQNLITVNGVPLCGTGDLSVIHVKPDTPPHVGVVVGGSKMKVNGITIAMVGDITGCGASLVSGEDLMQIS